MRGGVAVGHQHRAHAELRRGRGGGARVIRLHAAGGNQRVGAFRPRLRRDQRQLAHLVPSEPERDRIVALDEETRRRRRGSRSKDGIGSTSVGDGDEAAATENARARREAAAGVTGRYSKAGSAKLEVRLTRLPLHF